MLEASVLLVFVAGLLFCLIAGLPILLAILFGYLVFFAYGLSRGKRAFRLLAVSLTGIRSVKNILITFMLIGMLTAVWRACGAIATIICASTRVMRPDLMVVICFWLCCLISLLTGTSFGSAATMGVICMSISNVMGIPPVYAGGAILSGTFFGDRCSPMSTSAQLICTITGTDIYRNIRRMLQTCVVPFLLTSGLYLVLGLLSGAREAPADVIEIFERNYRLGWIPLIPALITVLFSLLRLNVKVTMLASILAGGAICLWVQGIAPLELFWICLRGFRAADPELAAFSNGGGVLSMLNVGAIVCISSTYSELFEETGLLNNTHALIGRLAVRINPFGAVMVVSILTSAICCNQSLSTVVVKQLCDHVMPDRYELALTLEDTVILLAALIPWSIAGSVPLAASGAPLSSILFACYLYLLPLCSYLSYSRGRGWPASPDAPVRAEGS